MDEERQISNHNGLWETGYTMLKGALVPGAAAALWYGAIKPWTRSNGIELPQFDANGIKEALLLPEGMVAVGFMAGLTENVLFRMLTFRQLEGKTKPGTYEPNEVHGDEMMFKVTCVDARRPDDRGGAIPGGFAVFGAPLNSALVGSIIRGLGHNTPASNLFFGYFLGRNAITGMEAHIRLAHEVMAISKKFPDNRLRIEVEDHFDGCGAEGITNEISYYLKFVAHRLGLADLRALPNEVAGYSYTNLILAPAVALMTGGRVTLAAVAHHTPMTEVVH